jgi:hypothetical protein
MKNIVIGSDHACVELKSFLKDFLQSAGYSVSDIGTFSKESCDYPDIAKEMANYIEKNPDKIIQSEIHEYCKAHGCKIRVANYKKILQLLIEDGHLVSNGSQKKGHRLATSVDELKQCYLNNIVGTSTPWLRHNDVTYELIEKINNWIKGTKNKKPTRTLF